MKISVVIPVYNEEKRIEETAKRLDEYLKGITDEYSIVFSNDGSVDKTFDLAVMLEKQYPSVKAVGYSENKGKGRAVRNGILASDGDIVLFTDCDLAYGTDVIKMAVDLFEKTGADIVIGSRNLDGDSYEGYTLMRKLMSKVYFKIISTASGFKLTDSQCGFKCFKKAVAHEIFSECTIDSFAFDLEALIKAQKKGYTVAELPVKIINHDDKGSKVRIIKDTLRMLGDIRRIRKQNK